MRVQQISASILNRKFCPQRVSFKGRNDRCKEKDHVQEHATDFYGSGSNGAGRYHEHTYYNSYGQVLEEVEYKDIYGQRNIYKKNTYSYYPNGILKSKYVFKPGYNERRQKAPEYDYYDYKEDGSLYRHGHYDWGRVIETFYNDGNIAEKRVIKPGYINDGSYHTVELLFKAIGDKIPYRVLAKEGYTGKLLMDITDIRRLRSIVEVGNKIKII